MASRQMTSASYSRMLICLQKAWTWPSDLEVVDGLEDLLDGLDDDVDELLHLGRRPGQLEGPHPAGHALDAVEDVVEAAGQAVDVLALERRDEGVAELGEDARG